MARVRYQKSGTIGAGADALGVRCAIDIVDFPYVNSAVSTLDTTTLAPFVVDIQPRKESLAVNGVPDEADIANLAVKIYDQNETVINILLAGMASGKRLQFITWHNAGGTYQPDYFVIDKTSITEDVQTITIAGTRYDSCISFTAISLLKQVLQEYSAGSNQLIAIEINTRYGFMCADGGVWQLGINTSLGTETTPSGGGNQLNTQGSAATMLANIKLAFPIHGKYFINAVMINPYANPVEDKFNSAQAANQGASNVLLLTFDSAQFLADTGQSWIYTTGPAISAQNDGSASPPGGTWTMPGSPPAAPSIYIYAYNISDNARITMHYNGPNGNSASQPGIPSETITDLTVIDTLITGYTGGSLYQSPATWYAPYFYWFLKAVSTQTLSDKLVALNDLLKVFAFILRRATDVTIQENVSANIDWLGAQATQPSGTIPTVAYGAGNEPPRTTTITTGVNSATQTVADTTGYAAGQRVWFATAKVYRIILSVGVGTITFTAAVTSTTGEVIGGSQLASVIALSETGYLRDQTNTTTGAREYALANQANLYDALKLVCDSVLGVPTVLFDATEGLTLKLGSALSANIPIVISGEIVPRKGTLKRTPSKFNVNSTNCGVKRPPGAGQWGQNDNLGSSVLSPQKTAPAAYNGSGVAGQTMFGTYWSNWSGGSSTAVWWENQMMLFSSPNPPNTVVYGADYDMFDSPTSGDPFSASAPFCVNQGWGGGALETGTAVQVRAKHWQFALAQGLFSLYCVGDCEYIEFEVNAPTLALLEALRKTPLFGKVQVRTDALHWWLIIGHEYNVYNPARTIKLNCIRKRT